MLDIIQKENKVKLSITIDKDLNEFLNNIVDSFKEQGKKANKSLVIQSIVRRVKEASQARAEVQNG